MYSVDKVYDSNFNKFRVTALNFEGMKKNSGDPPDLWGGQGPKDAIFEHFWPYVWSKLIKLWVLLLILHWFHYKIIEVATMFSDF